MSKRSFGIGKIIGGRKIIVKGRREGGRGEGWKEGGKVGGREGGLGGENGGKAGIKGKRIQTQKYKMLQDNSATRITFSKLPRGEKGHSDKKEQGKLEGPAGVDARGVHIAMPPSFLEKKQSVYAGSVFRRVTE